MTAEERRGLPGPGIEGPQGTCARDRPLLIVKCNGKPRAVSVAVWHPLTTRWSIIAPSSRISPPPPPRTHPQAHTHSYPHPHPHTRTVRTQHGTRPFIRSPAGGRRPPAIPRSGMAYVGAVDEPLQLLSSAAARQWLHRHHPAAVWLRIGGPDTGPGSARGTDGAGDDPAAPPAAPVAVLTTTASATTAVAAASAAVAAAAVAASAPPGPDDSLAAAEAEAALVLDGALWAHPDPDIAAAEVLGALYVAGVPQDWAAACPAAAPVVSLPPVPLGPRPLRALYAGGQCVGYEADVPPSALDPGALSPRQSATPAPSAPPPQSPPLAQPPPHPPLDRQSDPRSEAAAPPQVPVCARDGPGPVPVPPGPSAAQSVGRLCGVALALAAASVRGVCPGGGAVCLTGLTLALPAPAAVGPEGLRLQGRVQRRRVRVVTPKPRSVWAEGAVGPPVRTADRALVCGRLPRCEWLRRHVPVSDGVCTAALPRGRGRGPPPPPPNRRPNSADLADLFRRFVGFLNFADLFC